MLCAKQEGQLQLIESIGLFLLVRNAALIELGNLSSAREKVEMD